MSHLNSSCRSLLVAVVMGLMLFGGVPWSVQPPEVSAKFQAPPAGHKPIYVFPGLMTKNDDVTVAVHCTNVDNSKGAEFKVEFYAKDSKFLGIGGTNVEPGETKTVVANLSGTSPFFAADVIVALASPGQLVQGSARVVAQGTTKLVCTAQVYDSTSATPSFVYTVPHFSPAGKH